MFDSAPASGEFSEHEHNPPEGESVFQRKRAQGPSGDGVPETSKGKGSLAQAVSSAQTNPGLYSFLGGNSLTVRDACVQIHTSQLNTEGLYYVIDNMDITCISYKFAISYIVIGL